MQKLRERLDVDLAKASAVYRNLVPTEQDRLVQEIIEEVLDKHYASLIEAAKTRLTKVPTTPGKDDSWSW